MCPICLVIGRGEYGATLCWILFSAVCEQHALNLKKLAFQLEGFNARSSEGWVIYGFPKVLAPILALLSHDIKIKGSSKRGQSHEKTACINNVLSRDALWQQFPSHFGSSSLSTFQSHLKVKRPSTNGRYALQRQRDVSLESRSQH